MGDPGMLQSMNRTPCDTSFLGNRGKQPPDGVGGQRAALLGCEHEVRVVLTFHEPQPQGFRLVEQRLPGSLLERLDSLETALDAPDADGSRFQVHVVQREIRKREPSASGASRAVSRL